jgi:hypothetical protein
MTDTSEVQPEEAPAENPESQPEAVPADPETEEPEPEIEAAEEAPEDSAKPQILFDDAGQYVQMPDGSKVYTRPDNYPRSNTEWEKFEITHSGDQERYSLKPGDKGYNPLSDPSIPNSHLATQVAVQLSSFGERVQSDPNARPSVTWDALQPGWNGALEAHAETGVGGGKIVE